jgi:uncharacterized membrane protein YdbT with pleckstrin-like domain
MENQYQQPNQYQNYNPTPEKNQSVVSIGDWIVTLLIMIIPLLNIIMLFVWAFGGGTAESKSNWAKAMLIFMLIGFVLSIVFWSAFAATILSSLR